MRIRHAVLLAASVCAMPAAAQNTAPAPVPAAGAVVPGAAQAPASAEAPELGRLFFTPAERAHLDELRRRPPSPPQVAVTSQAEQSPAAPTPQYITVNGVVRRSDGTTTVWVNNKPVTGRRAEDGVVVTPSGARGSGNVTVRVPATGRSVDLKVGQQLEVHSGQVQEAYESPRAVAAAETAAETRTPEPAPAPPSLRRPNRERDLLRDLLREIEGPAGQPGAAAKSAPNAPPR
jgi:hypothetical protein